MTTYTELKYQFFPRSMGMSGSMIQVVECFAIHYNEITSYNNTLSSNSVLEILRPDLEKIGYTVEAGKKDAEKIKVPVLFGYNNYIDKFFNADALSNDGKTVIEVEAGRAVDNNQFLKDIFQASMMHDVEFLIIAVRQCYRDKNDFQKVYLFLETMYISNRIKLPLKGILLIGY
jgi:hypothetical protein